MSNSLRTKDILLIALLTAVYVLIYFVAMMATIPLGAFGHSISPGLGAVVGGTVIYFMAKKIGKMWQYTIMTLLLMGVFSLIGAGYLPWLISSVLTAVVADLIASRSKTSGTGSIALASGIMHMGQAWGAIIPSLFFVEKYKSDWIARGQTPEQMDGMIRYTSGMWALYTSLIVFVLSVVGVYIAHAILKKHFSGNE